MIVVTGATGTVGSEVVRQLNAAGQKVRALVRDPAKAEKLKGANVEIAKGDLTQPETVRAALQGAAKLFLMYTRANLPAVEAKVVEEAKKAGVKHIVYLSVMGAEMEPGIALGRGHRATEKAIEAAGIQHTFLRPSGFMTNMFNNLDSIKAQGKFYGPWGDGKMGLIHPADIAAVAVKALTTPGHEGKAYVLTGSESINNGEQAKILGQAVGKPIEYIAVPPEAAADSMLKGGMPKGYVDMLIEFSGAVRAGFTAATTGDVEKVLGRKPKTFADWSKENAAAFK